MPVLFGPDLLLGEELVAIEVRGDGHQPPQQRQSGGRLLGFVLVAVAEDLDAGVDQEDTENQQHPPELGDQRRSEDHEGGAQSERTEDSPEQDPVLVLERDRHRGEQHRPNEHIVDAERLLDQIAADVLAEGTAAELDRDEYREAEPTCNPHSGLDQRFLRRRCVVIPVAEQVDREHRRDRRGEEDPRPYGHVEIDEGFC